MAIKAEILEGLTMNEAASSSLHVNRRFVRTYCIHVQGETNQQAAESCASGLLD
jgi:hypothetical protein